MGRLDNGGRFKHTPTATVLGREVAVATGFRARLLGLAFMDRAAAPVGLLIPGCAAVHSFGMRFDLDLRFLDEAGSPLARRHLPPRRFARVRAARSVLELPAGVSR